MSQLPKHGFIALGRPVSVSEVAVPLPVAEPLQLNVALEVDTTLHCVTSVCRLYFFFASEVSGSSFQVVDQEPGKKDNGAVRFSGKRTVKPWPCIRASLEIAR